MGLNDYKLGLKNKKKRSKIPGGPKEGKKQGLFTQSVQNRLSLLGTNQLFKFGSDSGAWHLL